MEIRSNNKIYIIAPLSHKISAYETIRLEKEIKTEANNKIVALDLNNVSDCTIEFIEFLRNISKKQTLGIFNISSDIFTLFNFMGIDKTANLFTSELDFKENSRKLINRNFCIV